MVTICIGKVVRVIYPDYARGMEGFIEAQEKNGRWLVRLEQNPFNYRPESILLSLEQLEFEVIEEWTVTSYRRKLYPGSMGDGFPHIRNILQQNLRSIKK